MLVATIVIRFAFVFSLAGVLSAGTPWMRRQAWSPAVAGLVSWAGMRGVVTLAAAQVLPEDLANREVLLLAAFTVVVGSLLVQGSTLPWLVRRVGLPPPDPAEDALRAAELGDAATAAGLARLAEVVTGDEPARGRRPARGPVHRPVARHLGTARPAAGRPGDPVEHLRPAADGDAGRRARGRHPGPGRRHGAGEVLEAALAAIDVEESLLDRHEELESRERDRALAPRPREANCDHLRQAPAGEAHPEPAASTAWSRAPPGCTCAPA